MDELEFRRRITADPFSLDEELTKLIAEDQEKQQFVEQMQAFDSELEQGLSIPVPNSLADNIIANTYAKAGVNEEPASDNVIDAKKRFSRLYMAAAASFLVAISAFFMAHKYQPINDLGEAALAHLYHEVDSIKSDKTISLATVNEKFASIGGYLSELPGKVKYLMICDFQGKKGLHLVFESEHGPVTAFIIPDNKQAQGVSNNQFNDERFTGLISHKDNADTILIANLNTPLDRYTGRINDAIRWLH